MRYSLRSASRVESRLTFLALLFILELVVITVLVDGDAMLQRGGIVALLGLSGSWMLRAIIAFLACLVVLVSFGNPSGLGDAIPDLQRFPLLNLPWLATHIALLLIVTSTARLIQNGTALVWILVGLAAIVTGALALVPFPCWQRLFRATRQLWIYALAASLTACLLAFSSRALWASAAQWTFFLVKGILGLVVSGVTADRAHAEIGTETFHVEIAPQCSGMEGAALMLGFGCLWLWLFRREFRFPRALLLLPVCIAILFLLNAVRIAVLILIGNAGAPDIAVGGFHSQAGWILFNGVAIALMLGARRVQWLTVHQPESGSTPRIVLDSPALPYLMPFLAILAASMISRAATGNFEWLYPLRIFACAAALWIFRDQYKKLDWRFGWEAPVVGVLVLALWLAGDWLMGIPPASQDTWLTLRVTASIIMVPVAEELAFRGYLIRRILSADFECLSPTSSSITALAISSLAFGILHGERWIAGTIAGLLYGLVFIRRGRIGDAVIAHATTNGLLAASVLITGQWNLS